MSFLVGDAIFADSWLNEEKYFCLLGLCLVFEHCLDKSDDLYRVKRFNILFKDAAQDHLEIKLVIDEALKEIRLKVDHLEQLLDA